jgi:hypothetical protein
MTPRAKLQWAYELAFHPAKLNEAWNDWERGRVTDVASLQEVVDWAFSLHQRLPEAPAVTGRALCRLASYQATSRLYRMPSMLRRFRAKLGLSTATPEEVPAWMVRDIGLPIFGRVAKRDAGSSSLFRHPRSDGVH